VEVLIAREGKLFLGDFMGKESKMWWILINNYLPWNLLTSE